MELRSTFQSIISLHQEELPFALQERSTQLPLDGNRIVTVTGIRRCGKSSLLGLTINRLLQQGIPKEHILYVGFDDERFLSMPPENFDELLQAYREMYPDTSLKDVYMFFDEIQLIEGWELFVLRVYKNYCKHIYITGSTAKMLSEEMASALRGWPDEYREYPLSFKEYLAFKGTKANPFSEAGKAKLAVSFRLLRGGRFSRGCSRKKQDGKSKNPAVLLQHHALQGYGGALSYRNFSFGGALFLKACDEQSHEAD